MQISILFDMIAASKQLYPMVDTTVTSAPHCISFLKTHIFPRYEAYIMGVFWNQENCGNGSYNNNSNNSENV